MMNNTLLNVAYSCNDAYIPQTGISITSLLDTNIDFDEINVYFISVNVSESNLILLKELIRNYNRNVVIIPFHEICFRLKINALGRHIETVYAKLFFGNIPGVDKIFYLDSDTIINGSLKELWDIDLGSNYFGCVKTITKDYCKALSLPNNEDFFNDGVALVNVRALREDQMENKFLTFIAKHNGNPPVLSEGVINVVCKGRILALHPKYNSLSAFFMFSNKQITSLSNQRDFYLDEELNAARSIPIVIHYLAGWYNRPWNQDCSHPLKSLYLKYKAVSAWKELPLFDKKLPAKLKVLKILYKVLPVNTVMKLLALRPNN